MKDQQVGHVETTWSVSWEMAVRRRGTGEIKWVRSPGIEVPDEDWVRQQFKKRKAEGLPDHLRNLQMVKITREIVEA